jgi:hypothetical protein
MDRQFSMDHQLANARARWAALVDVAKTQWDALSVDPREKRAGIALATLLAGTAIVWGLSHTEQPKTKPAVIVALAPAAQAPAPSVAAPQPAPAPEPAPAPAAQASNELALPAPPTATPYVSGGPAKTTSPAPEVKTAEKTAKPAAKESVTKESTTKEAKIAKKIEPKVAALPPASGDALEPTGSVSAKTPIDSEARSYEAFSTDIDKLTRTEFNTPKDIRAAFDQLLKHQPEKLSDGWIAYSARVVAANDTFSKAVDAEVAKRGRDTVMAKIASDPAYVNKLPGAFDALDGLMKQVARDTSKLSQLGDRFIQTAYAFQKKKWGEASPQQQPHYAAAETARVIPAGLFSRDDKPAAATPVGVTQRVLMLAASLDAGGPEAASSKALMHDPGLSQCMRWARLNLNQCLAAAYFPSEQAYCTGKHAINEVNACWTRLLPQKG